MGSKSTYFNSTLSYTTAGYKLNYLWNELSMSNRLNLNFIEISDRLRFHSSLQGKDSAQDIVYFTGWI